MKLMGIEWLHVACRQLRQNLVVVVLVTVGLLGMAPAKMGHGQAMSTTTVQGTLYMANGQTGSGTLQVSWPSFTTAAGQAVVAGNTTVAVGSDGFVSVNLTPNVGASPAGLYYTAVFYLSNGTTTTQYWVVPAAAQATLAQVQSQVMPAAQAVQAVSKAYVDQAIAEAGQSQMSTSGQTLTGPLYLNADPTQAMQAADKHYVDVSVSQSSTQPGTSGQIAYYTGTGTAIAGTSAVPVTAGGTGAGTAVGALQNLGGISATAMTQQAMAGGLSIAGQVAAKSVTASVNSQLNVMAPPFNAKGDCVTDDSAAIQAALNVQKTGSTQITVYFPAPPGGCYLTSTLTMTGASLQGQAGAGFVGSGGGVVLQGKPSQDVLHIPDPTTVGSVGPRGGWTIRDLVIKADDSVDASSSFPHRWPGKWVQDGAINAGSHTLSSIYAEFTCGDIGQNILVKGAGTAGADLSTTIASVTPCWGNYSSSGPTVTLTAAAGTTVTNAYTYITPANIPVTQHIGNCGFAADNYDGNSADWVMTGGTGTFQPQLWNVTFTSTTQNPTHNVCAWYSSGSWAPYMMDAKNVWVWNQEWGIIQATPDTNPASSPGIGQDYQKWDHGWLYATYPWISYNGGLTTLTDIQLTAGNGPQVLQVKSTAESAPNGWYIHVPEFELATGVGWRIEGYAATILQTELCDGKTGVIDTMDSRLIDSDCGGTLDFNGENNWLDGGGAAQPNIVNKGMDNIYDGSQVQGSSGMWSTTVMTQTLNRGRQAWGTLTPDFIRSGTAPYYSDHDLFIWPQDLTDIYGYEFNVVADSNSWTGNYAAIPVAGYDLMYFNNMYMLGRTNTNQIYAGSNIPAGKVLVYFSYKCPSITTFTATVRAYGGGTTVGGPAVESCTTSYQTASIVADFSSYLSQALDLNISAGEVDIAWMAIKPLGAATFTSATIPGAPSGSYIKADGTGYGTPSSGVTQISAGTNVTISPSNGTGNVTINASGSLPVRALLNQVNDVFQRTGASLGTGYTNYINGWTPNGGSSHGTDSSASHFNIVAYTGQTTVASQHSEVVINSISGTSDYIGAAVSISGTPTTSVSMYSCNEGVADAHLYLSRYTGISNTSQGTGTTLATAAAITPAVGDDIVLSRIGNTLYCYRNGAFALAGNDTSPLPAGYAGMDQAGDTNTISSFTFTNPVAAASCNVNIVADGDSITYGDGIPSPYTDAIYTTEGTVPCIANLGASYKGVGAATALPSSGGNVESMLTTGTSVVDPLFVGGIKNIDVIWGCTNDIALDSRTPAQCNTDLTSYITARHAAGWKVVLVQTLSRGTTDTLMQYLNNLTASGTGADEVVTLNHALTGTGAYANLTLFQSNQVHPTQFAQSSLIAPAISAAINALR